jgi:hypothetical protein
VIYVGLIENDLRVWWKRLCNTRRRETLDIIRNEIRSNAEFAKISLKISRVNTSRRKRSNEMIDATGEKTRLTRREKGETCDIPNGHRLVAQHKLLVQISGITVSASRMRWARTASHGCRWSYILWLKMRREKREDQPVEDLLSYDLWSFLRLRISKNENPPGGTANTSKCTVLTYAGCTSE